MTDETTEGATSDEEIVVENEVVNEEVVNEVAETENVETETTTEEPEAYVPNYNYKHMDQELAFDERLHGIVKSKEDEDFLRDLHTRASGFDPIKEQFGSMKKASEVAGHYEQWEQDSQNLNNINGQLDTLNGYIANGHYGKFFEYLGIKENDVIKYAAGRAQYYEMTPEEKQAHDHQQNLVNQNYELQNQVNMMQNSTQEQSSQARGIELDGLLSTNQVAKAYDAQVGKPGAFRQEVINHGSNAFYEGQRLGKVVDVSPMDAIAAVTQRLGGFGQESQQQNPQQQTQTKDNPAQTVVINRQAQGTIPAMGGSSQSPARKTVKSLDDLRKLAKTF